MVYNYRSISKAFHISRSSWRVQNCLIYVGLNSDVLRCHGLHLKLGMIYALHTTGGCEKIKQDFKSTF